MWDNNTTAAGTLAPKKRAMCYIIFSAAKLDGIVFYFEGLLLALLLKGRNAHEFLWRERGELKYIRFGHHHHLFTFLFLKHIPE